MTLPDLKTAIIENKIPHFLIFVGEDIELMKVYIDKITAENPLVVDSVSLASKGNGKRSLLNTKKQFLVIDDTAFISADEAEQDSVRKQFVESDNTLILQYTSVDKRKSFFKRFSDDTVEFPHMTENVLKKHICEFLRDFSVEYATDLIDNCEGDWGRIVSEMDKIDKYSKALCITADDSYKQLIADGTIYSPIGDITFKLTDAVIYGDIEKSLYYLDKAKKIDEPPLRIISILYNNFRNMLLVQGLGSNKSKASQLTGLNDWGVKNVLKQIGSYSIQEIIRALRVLQYTEQAFKSGEIEQSIALDYAVLNILK